MSETTIFYTPQLRERWPAPLAHYWATAYPCLLDADDLRITHRQPKNHFNEWFAAIHLFHRDGTLALLEKYLYSNHLRKTAIIAEVLTVRQIAVLQEILSEFKVQPPDLFVFTPSRPRFWFAEVKGPGDRLRPLQKASHRAIRQRLNAPVELINVRPSAHPAQTRLVP